MEGDCIHSLLPYTELPATIDGSVDQLSGQTWLDFPLHGVTLQSRSARGYHKSYQLVVGKIQFLLVVGLEVPDSCWLEGSLSFLRFGVMGLIRQEQKGKKKWVPTRWKQVAGSYTTRYKGRLKLDIRDVNTSRQRFLRISTEGFLPKQLFRTPDIPTMARYWIA